MTWSRTIAMCALLACASLASASTRVLMMPDRPAFTGAPIVVWGNTTFANSSTYTLDFGDGSTAETGAVTDATYIATTHTYAAAGTYTARLTVSDATPANDSETAIVTVTDPAAMTALDRREAQVEMAIEDGLRFLYTAQADRTARPTTSWPFEMYGGDLGYTISGTSLVTLAFQNHGHLVTNDPNKDIYQDVVQRGLNFIFDQLAIQPLTVEVTGLNPMGYDPCAGDTGPAPCDGLGVNQGYTGYSTLMATLAVAAATGTAPGRLVADGLGANNAQFVAGKTYAQILQRLVDTIAWAQSNQQQPSDAEGGWRYYLNDGSDGSAIGWGVLALLDSAAAGAAVPSFIATELANAVAATSCSNSADELTMTYESALNGGACDGYQNVAKAGVLLQALDYMGVPKTDPRVQLALTYISKRWEGELGGGGGGEGGSDGGFDCSITPNGTYTPVQNKACAYGMFNSFKGLRLYAVDTLPGVARPAGPGDFPASAWYEDYRDFLVGSQQMPADPTGGFWGQPSMDWSCCSDSTLGITAVAEIILSPTALVLPTNLTLSPQTATNPPGTSHTVTATATTASGAPAPAATVQFKVLSGPDAGMSGQGTTDSNGQASFTYTNNGTTGTDQIQANIGKLTSNIVTKTWGTETPPKKVVEDCNNCIDDDGDGLVDYEDPDCCAPAANLEVFSGKFKGLAKKGHGHIRLHSRLGAIGITEQSPLNEDTTIQFRNANGELLCATVGHEHWMRMHGDSKFWDRSGRLAKGLQDGTIRTKKDGTVVFRTFSNIMDLSKYNQSQLQVTVRVGNKCSRGSVQLRSRKDRLVFP